MIKPHCPEIGIRKENVRRRPARRVRPTSYVLIKKYLRQQQTRSKSRRSPNHEHITRRQGGWPVPDSGYRRQRMLSGGSGLTSQVRGHEDITPWRSVDKMTSRNDGAMVIHYRAHYDEQGEANKVVMVGIMPCTISSEVHVNGQCVTQWEGKGATDAREEPVQKRT
jgi:hypothetical protein